MASREVREEKGVGLLCEKRGGRCLRLLGVNGSNSQSHCNHLSCVLVNDDDNAVRERSRTTKFVYNGTASQPIKRRFNLPPYCPAGLGGAVVGS